MKITPRVVSDYTYGKCLYYSRTINGTPYSFTFVLMDNGERRHFVSKYNGYCQEGIESGLMDRKTVLSFDCAWSQVHAIITNTPECMPIGNEIELSMCEYGCKIYRCNCGTQHVFHSRTYGCTH